MSKVNTEDHLVKVPLNENILIQDLLNKKQILKISTLLVKLILYINLSTNIYADCNKYFLIQSNTHTFKLFLSHKIPTQ